MKLGFVSAILPDLPLEEVLKFAGKAGYDCVELMCWPVGKAERRYAGVTHVDVTGLDEAGAKKIKALCEGTGVGISALGYYPNFLAPDAAEAAASIEHFKKVMRAAPLLGINTVTTFVGRDWTKSVEANWPQVLRAWKPLAELAGQLDLRIAIENCPMLFTKDEWPGGKNIATSPAIWRRLFADLGSDRVGLNFDPSHFIWQQMDYLRAIREFRDRIYHAHAKDARLDRHLLDEVGILAHPLEYHTPKLPGLGDVDWGLYFSVLGDVGYDGPVCVEVEDRAYEKSLETRKDALSQSARFLRQFMRGR